MIKFERAVVWCGAASALVVSVGSESAFALGRGRGQALTTIRAEKTVPQEQMKTLRADFDWLATVKPEQTDPEMLRVMGLKDAEPASMSGWITDRVHYLLSEKFEPKLWNLLPFFFKSFSYPNPGVLPDIEKAEDQKIQARIAEKAAEFSLDSGNQSELENDHEADNDKGEPVDRKKSSSAKVVMSNMGSALYLGGKTLGIVMGVRMKGIGRIPVTSPRTGVIMVGEGLFYDGYFGSDIPKDSPVRSGFRMATFFHEARHSDGNGKSLGFLHGLCPAGHDYAGLGACDRNLNGPYTVGALVQEHMAANCSSCSEREREALRVFALESRSRIISQRDGQSPTEWDAAPEGSFEGF